MISAWDSFHRMLKHLLFHKTFLYSLFLIFATLFSPIAFLCSLLGSTKNEYIFGFKIHQIVQYQHHPFQLLPYQQVICLNRHHVF